MGKKLACAFYSILFIKKIKIYLVSKHCNHHCHALCSRINGLGRNQRKDQMSKRVRLLLIVRGMEQEDSSLSDRPRPICPSPSEALGLETSVVKLNPAAAFCKGWSYPFIEGSVLWLSAVRSVCACYTPWRHACVQGSKRTSGVAGRRCRRNMCLKAKHF